MARPQGVYRDKNGTWYFKARTHQDGAGKWKQVTRRGFGTATDARLARQRLLDETQALRDGSARAIDRDLTVGQLVDRYLEVAEAMKRLGPKTLFDYRNYVESYIRLRLGHLLANELQPSDLVKWQVELSRNGAVKREGGLSSNTIRLARAPLNGAFKFGLGSGLVHRNPVAETRPPARTKSIPAHWSPEQAREFLAWHEGDRMFPLWAFMLSTGLRIGELVWLEWSDVDLPNQRVHVQRFATTLGYDLHASTGKSVDAVRTVELDEHLVGILRQQLELQCEAHGRPLLHVFTKPGGEPYHPQGLSKLLGRISTEIGLPRLTAHGLRHTSATLMLASGIQPRVAAERLGHADATLFSNLYSHVTPTMQRQAARAISVELFDP